MKKAILLVVIFLMVSLMFGCITVANKIETDENYIINERSTFDSKKAISTFVIKNNNKGKIWGELTSPFIHWSKIIGDVTEDKEGNINFDIISIQYLTNWPNGWTSGETEATGSISFDVSADGWQAKINEPFETWEVINGEIRYFDDYYRDEEGLKKVKNRIVRINAVNHFIKESELPEFFGHIWFKTPYGEPFKRTIRKFLFNRNTQYPDYLIKLKKSGTIRRDFEEAFGLFFMDYNIEYYFNNILDKSYFKERD